MYAPSHLVFLAFASVFEVVSNNGWKATSRATKVSKATKRSGGIGIQSLSARVLVYLSATQFVIGESCR
jgi:hypothetical protein